MIFKIVKDSNRFSQLEQGAGKKKAGDLLKGERYRGHTDAEILLVLLIFTK